MERVDLEAAAFFTSGFDVTFGLPATGAVGLIVACVAGTVFFATDLVVRVGMVSTALARRTGFSAAFTVAFLTRAIACVARRSDATDLTGLAGLVGLTTGAFVDVVLIVFVAACAAVCAAFPAVDLVDMTPLATLAALVALVALLGGTALANFDFSGVAGFALRATFSAFLLAASTGRADVLASVVAAGAVSHRVACFAATGVAFFAAFTFVAVLAVLAVPERFTTGFAGWSGRAGRTSLVTVVFTDTGVSAVVAVARAAFDLPVGAFVTVDSIC